MRGVPAEGSPDSSAAGPQPHARMGWARREASLDVPVGFYGYSYGITDIRFETIHRSRFGKLFQPKAAKPKSKTAAAGKNDPTIIELKDDIQEAM